MLLLGVYFFFRKKYTAKHQLLNIRKDIDIQGDKYFARVSKENIILGNTMEVETLGFFTLTSCSHKNSLKIEGGWFASIVHKDTWDTVEESYEKLFRYIKDNGYEIAGDSIEFFNEVIVHLGKGEGSTIQITFPLNTMRGKIVKKPRLNRDLF